MSGDVPPDDDPRSVAVGGNLRPRAERSDGFRRIPVQAIVRFERAAKVDSLDPVPMGMLAEQYRAAAVQAGMNDNDRLKWLDQAVRAMEAGRLRDRVNPAWAWRLAQVLELRHDLTGLQSDLESAVREAEAAADGNPTYSRFHVKCGDLLTRLWEATDRDEYRQRAIDAYKWAVNMADAIPRTGEYPRLYDEERDSVVQALERLTNHPESGAAGSESE